MHTQLKLDYTLFRSYQVKNIQQKQARFNYLKYAASWRAYRSWIPPGSSFFQLQVFFIRSDSF